MTELHGTSTNSSSGDPPYLSALQWMRYNGIWILLFFVNFYYYLNICHFSVVLLVVFFPTLCLFFFVFWWTDREPEMWLPMCLMHAGMTTTRYVTAFKDKSVIMCFLLYFQLECCLTFFSAKLNSTLFSFFHLQRNKMSCYSTCCG